MSNKIKIDNIKIMMSGKNRLKKSDVTLQYYESEKGKILQIEGEFNYYLFKSVKSFEINAFLISAYVDGGELNIEFYTQEDATKLNQWLKTSKKKASDINQEIIENSFLTVIRENKEIKIDSKDFLKNEILRLIDEYKNPLKRYYAPYTIICQSSGFGKSRACLSLVKDFLVVYCCFRIEESAGYPKRSSLASDLLKPENTEKTFMCYLNLFIDILNENNLNSEEFFAQFGKKDADSQNNLVDLFATKFSQAKDDVFLSIYNGDKPLIFVFDEASNFLPTNFFKIRSILSGLKNNIFVLFLDTFYDISGFMPSYAVDPYERYRKQNQKLFDPIYLLPNWDVFADDSDVKTIWETINFVNVCKYGRVLWGSWMQTKARGEFKTIENKALFELATEKLIFGKDELDKFDDNDYLAIISSRAGIIKPKLVSTRQHLVAKNMAICTYVSNEKGVFEIDYPSEPILAAAAAELMNGKERLDEMLDTLIRNVETSLISQGHKGEIIAKLILLRAIDHAFNRSKKLNEVSVYFNVVKVGYFLQSLYGKCDDKCGNSENKWVCKSEKKECCIKMIKDQLENYTQLLNGYVNFNHFAKTDSSMKETSLVKALKRCAAIECKLNQKAVDLVIPVSLEDFHSITAIMVQVKLQDPSSKLDFSSAFDDISYKMYYDLAEVNPYLLLFMQLGCSEAKIETIDTNLHTRGENPKRAIIYSEGISSKIFPNLGQGIDEKLSAFSKANRKLFDVQTEREKSSIYKAIRYSIRSKSFYED